MVDTPGNAILVGLLEEVDGYLPDMRLCLLALKEDNGDTQAVTELHRMIHTIKGVASMLEIHELSKTAGLLENLVEHLIASTLMLNTEIIDLMSDTTERIDSSYAIMRTGGPDDSGMYGETLTSFQKVVGQLFSGPEMKEVDESVVEHITDHDIPPEDSNDALEDIFGQLPTSNDDADLEGLFELFELFEDEETDEHKEPENQESVFLEISTIDPELMESFNEEAEEHLENINKKLNNLSATITEQVEISDSFRKILHSIRRSVHTLKGAAAVIGIEQVAEWGHEFEDFLDWLHDESSVINSEIVSVMLDGTDIIEKIVDQPTVAIGDEKKSVAVKFQSIIDADTSKIVSKQQTSPQDHTVEVSLAEKLYSIDSSVSPSPEKRNKKRATTLRLDVDKIDQVVGLSGDMAINLSSFNNSISAMTGPLSELSIILQRLKNINSSLEAGYELASIPHLAGMAEGRTGEGSTAEDFDPLEMDRYSELNILIRSLSEAVVDLESIQDQSTTVNDSWQAAVDRQSRILKEIQNNMYGIRMTPFSTLSNRLYKTVREAVKATGHQAKLLIEGGSLTMDTRVWDMLADPLMHILRNAVSHGGTPESFDGQQKNSARDGLTIQITGSRLGGQFTLRINDNGKGLDYDAIREKGTRQYPKTGVELMSNEGLAELIFRHGFSSAASITTISGRGVGMDVVRNAVELLNGSIQIFSHPGEGVELVIRVPVAVAQLPAILVRFGSHIYAIPMRDVKRVIRIDSGENIEKDFDLEGKTLPLLRPSQVLQSQKSGYGLSLTEFPQNLLAVLIVDVGGKQGALLCDEIVGQQEIIHKDLGSHLKSVPCIAGVTIMGDGRLVPILNTEDLLKVWPTASQITDTKSPDLPEKGKQLQILIVDDSISVRKVLSNLIVEQGWQPVAARDGIEAVEKIREEKPDVILLDIEMPRMNGFEVLQALQAQAANRDIPVAMLTSRSAEKYRKKASSLGARGFVTKPFKEEELVTLITGLTGH